MATVALLGTLDTKGQEYLWLAQRLSMVGMGVILIDAGTFSDADYATISSRTLAGAVGVNIDDLRKRNDRGESMDVISRGAAAVVSQLQREGKIDGILSVAGSGGSSVAARAMQALPVGFPKLLVSTMASGDVRPYVGDTDVTMMYSVVDIAGINMVSERVLGNAAAAITGMAAAYAARGQDQASPAGKPLIGMTMFGVTTPAADEARETLTELGYEVLVFHATGAGGKAMESLATSGLLAGVLDLTTTELADELVGGVLTAGPDRLEAAGKAGIPQIVSLGALDMVNFGAQETIPASFDGRHFLVHNPLITLMRTTVKENAILGAQIGEKLSKSHGPVEVFIPLRGVSLVDVEGGPFYDPVADAALFEALRTSLRSTKIPVHERDQAINDPGFGRALATALHNLITHS